MRPKGEIEKTIDLYGDTVWRVCVLYFKRHTDAQDAFQETFLKYSISDTTFKEEEHRKAWLIRVATNVCKDMLKASYRKALSIDDQSVADGAEPESADLRPDSALSEALDAIRSLTDPPRTPVYLALYEGYTAPEISKMLDAPVNTVWSVSSFRTLSSEEPHRFFISGIFRSFKERIHHFTRYLIIDCRMRALTIVEGLDKLDNSSLGFASRCEAPLVIHVSLEASKKRLSNRIVVT